MLRVVRLVNPGRPDKVIAFENLPDDLLDVNNPRIEKIDVRLTGLGRSWAELSPVHFPLFFKTINQDKDKWQKISNYVRQYAEDGVRLMDKIEDMAAMIAPDAQSQAFDPDIVPIVKLKSLATKKAELSVVEVKRETETSSSEIIIENEETEEEHQPEEDPKSIVKIRVKNGEITKSQPGIDKNIKHAKKCEKLGRGGVYTEDCPRCDLLKKRQEKELVGV